MTCDRCGREIRGARWTVPAPGGIHTICPRCVAIPVIEVAAPKVVLLTGDGRVIEMPDETVRRVD